MTRAAGVLYHLVTTASPGWIVVIDFGSFGAIGTCTASEPNEPGAQTQVLVRYLERPCSRAKASTTSFP